MDARRIALHFMLFEGCPAYRLMDLTRPWVGAAVGGEKGVCPWNDIVGVFTCT